MNGLNILEIALLVCLCATCRREDTSKYHILKMNLNQGLSSLDPAFAKDLSTTWLVGNLYDNLITLDENTQIQPQLAYRYEVSADASEYTFYLHDSVHFQEDACFKNAQHTRKLTAYDVVYSLKRLIDPQTASSGAWILNGKLDSVRPFEILDSFSLKIRLRKPNAQFLYILSMNYASIVPFEAVDFYGNDFRKHPVGSGPFRLKAWEEGTALVLQRNPHYFQKDSLGVRLPYLDFVKITFNEQRKLEYLSLLKGEIDFIKDVDISVAKEIFDDLGNLRPKLKSNFHLSRNTYLSTEYIAMLQNNPRSPLCDVRLRQAMNCAIDRKTLAEILKQNLVYPAENGFVARGMPNTDPNFRGWVYDPERARALLKSAGYSEGRKPKIQFHITDQYVDMAEFIVQNLNQVGFEVDLKLHPTETMMQLAAEGKIECFRRSWTADYPDAESNYACFYSQNGAPPNYTRFKNAAYDVLYQYIASEPNPEKRKIAYQKMEEILKERAPIVPLFYEQSNRIISNRIEGLRQNTINSLDLRRVQKRI